MSGKLMKLRGNKPKVMNCKLGIKGPALNIKKLIFDILFPIECLGCGREGQWLCESCLITIRPDSHSLRGESLDRILTFYSYDNELLKKAIHLLKYKFVEEMTMPLGELFFMAMKEIKRQIGCDVILIPVPLHNKRKLERGFNQAELLSFKLAEKFGWPVENRVLERVRYTVPQVDLEERDRYKNIRGSFAVRDSLKIINKKIILIDDVLTTGATMEECARVLKIAGAGEVWGMALAKG